MKNTEAILVRAGQDRSTDFAMCSYICLCLSRKDAEKFILTYGSSFPDSGRLLLLVLGLVPDKKLVRSLKPWLKTKKILLAMPDDLAGHAAAIKIACLLKGRTVSFKAMPSGLITIKFEWLSLTIPAQSLSLNKFEKETGFRSLMRVYKLKA